MLGAAVLAGVPATAQAARTTKPKDPAATWVKVTGGPRDYWVYTPSGRAPRRGRALVVYLHGCTQGDPALEAENAALAFGTRWNELAEEKNFVVAYPIQREFDNEHPEQVNGNGGTCWNWFVPGNQTRGSGEAKMIADITDAVVAAEDIDPTRVYTSGASAGADMAVIMATAYPDKYRAMAAWSGCAYQDCADVTGRLAYEAMGAFARPVPAALFEGSADMVNNYGLDQTLLQQQLGTADWADDGGPGSVDRVPVSENVHFDEAGDVSPDPTNACVENRNLPCAGPALGWENYPTTIDRYFFTGTSRVAVEHWTIHGLNHNYPYGDPASTFTDPAGPDVTRAAWTFFTRA
jgi:poly(hydroxyalkanoate) depolymerase family esterase